MTRQQKKFLKLLKLFFEKSPNEGITDILDLMGYEPKKDSLVQLMGKNKDIVHYGVLKLDKLQEKKQRRSHVCSSESGGADS